MAKKKASREELSMLGIALEMLALASSLLANCADLEDLCDTDAASVLHCAADDLQEMIGTITTDPYTHEANQL